MFRRIKILHLESQTNEARQISEHLKKEGLDFEVQVVDSREEFMSALDSFSFDVVLSDNSLPSFSSEEALQIVKALKENIPFIVVTHPVSEGFAVEMFRNGADDYVLKHQLELLPTAVQKAIEEYRLQKEVKENEWKYRSFFENSMDGILLTEPNGTILEANPAACQIFRMTEEEICQAERSEIVDVTDPKLAVALAERRARGKVKTEITMIRKGGGKFPVELTSSVYKNAEGKDLTSIIIRDISEKRQVEEELKLSKKQYDLQFQNSPLPSWIYNINSLKIEDVNEAAIKLYGYSREEFLNLTLKDLRPPEEIPALKYHIAQTRRYKKNARFGKFIHKKKDGSLLKVEVHGYGLKYKQEDCRLAVCNDVTEKEEVLQKLRENRKKLLSAQKIAKLGYWELNIETKALYWTEEVFEIWNRDHQVYQPSLEDLMQSIHPDDKEVFMHEQTLSLDGKKELDIEHRITLPDASIRWVHQKGKLVTCEKGKPIVFEGTVQDITEQKTALEKLRQSEARYKGLVKSQTNYLTRINLQGNYSYANDKYIQDFLWIFPDNQIIGKNAMASVKDYHHQRVKETFEKCLANPNHVFQIEIDKRQKNDGVRSTLWDFICLTDAKGQPLELQGVGVDITDRITAEKSLKESNKRYELVSKATSDAIWDWDLKTNQVYWGENFYTFFGYQPNMDTQTINFWSEHIHPLDKARVTENINNSILGKKKKWQEEYRFQKADGNYAFVIDHGFIDREENNKAVRMLGAVQDITRKKRLEDLLDKASQLAKIGSFEINLISNSIYWSPMTKKIHEVAKDFTPELKSIKNFIKERADRDITTALFRKAVEENEPYDMETQIVTALGNDKWVKVMVEPEFVNGKCVRLTGSIQDIDDLKETELAALNAYKEKEIILESIGDAFFAVDHNWIITYWNRHCAKLLECSREKALGKNLWEIFPDALDTKFEDRYRKAVQENSTEDFEGFFERVKKWFDVSAYPSASGLSVYFRDITERKKYDLQLLQLNEGLKSYTEELMAANKGLEQFSFIVSHNLRAPVANILGLGSLLTQDDYPQETKENLLEELLVNVQRLDVVITDLNSILQIKNSINEKKETVDLSRLVKSIISSSIQKEEVQILTDFNEVPEIYSIKSYLHSIFYNLIFNSIKYQKPNVPPIIKIKSEKQENSVLLTFQDNGMGIDLTKYGAQLFSLYKRFHHHVEGKGMGLFMVKTQVEMLGGKIKVESGVNKGTRFTIEFIDNLN